MQKLFFENFFSISPSLVISLALVFSFLFLSNFSLFIPVSTQQFFSFNLFGKPWNFLFYLFVHAGVAHLVSNVLLVCFLGRVVEGVLPKAHIFGLFFGVGVLSFALFNFLNHDIFGVGASGGSIALTAAALVLSPKKSFFALLSVVLVGLLLVAGHNFFQQLELQSLQSAKAQVKTELDSAVLSNNFQLVSEKTKELEGISNSLAEKEMRSQYQRGVQIANSVHFISAVLAIIYLFLFCRAQTVSSVKKTVSFFQGKRVNKIN